MERRSFVSALGGFGMFGLVPQAGNAAVTEKKTRYYLLEQYFMKTGPQLGRMHEFISKSLLPALEQAHSGPKIYLEALIAPHTPQLAAIYGFESLDHIDKLRTAVAQNPAFQKAMEALEAGPEAAFEDMTSALLEAAPYSPEIAAPAAGLTAPRLFEVRVYHSPTWRQLQALHERMAGPEMKIFHRVGVRPILYASTLAGARIPNLTYVIPFENLAAREKAWAAFGADPEWIKLREESTRKHGEVSSMRQIAIYRATPYSPVK
jgi:hypothetical protein